jgi:hypothetical protein
VSPHIELERTVCNEHVDSHPGPAYDNEFGESDKEGRPRSRTPDAIPAEASADRSFGRPRMTLFNSALSWPGSPLA